MRYTWDALNRLVKVERYVGGSYEPLAEMAYDGSLPLKAKRVGDDVRVGQRMRLTMWVAGQPLTTTYTADLLRPGRVLVAADGTTTRRYLYGQGPIGEFDGEWSYHLTDGGGSLRQVADAGGALTLVRTYKPFGAILEEQGSGESAYGYFGAWWDSGLGLLYWDGRYYDPVTGRFLSPQRGRRNPYSPYGMPLTMGLLAPLAVWSAAFGKRRRRWWHWLLLLVLMGMGVVAVGCEGETTPTIPVPPIVPPTPGAPEPPPSYTPPPTHTPLPPPTTTPIPETCTPMPPTPTPAPSSCPGLDEEDIEKVVRMLFWETFDWGHYYWTKLDAENRQQNGILPQDYAETTDGLIIAAWTLRNRYQSDLPYYKDLREQEGILGLILQGYTNNQSDPRTTVMVDESEKTFWAWYGWLLSESERVAKGVFSTCTIADPTGGKFEYRDIGGGTGYPPRVLYP